MTTSLVSSVTWFMKREKKHVCVIEREMEIKRWSYKERKIREIEIGLLITFKMELACNSINHYSIK